ncbi:undecaprenyl-diphosphatase [Roseiarcus fermentans]|uniref:Undecaprenyl-diphosphatase n=1 Tax=Roseiarcus fermentans TaxID=1473586 RepID=A0A366FHX7_9HYPH|nr:phosphatase PAP2 family protein [Roseiarcus fermentans]RBP14273.1 undecaprenyl-diphosphatase [Roseiarcus fermentans]
MSPVSDILFRADIWFVRVCARTARPALARGLAIAFSRAGNGGLYPVLAVTLLLAFGTQARAVVLLAAINIVLMHSVYPTIKRMAARARPFRSYTDLKPLLATLDEHSFPSGHVMTLTAALVPIALALPETLPLALGGWLAMAWARVASAHHYPSDILAGAALALVVSYPLSRLGLDWSAVGWSGLTWASLG